MMYLKPIYFFLLILCVVNATAQNNTLLVSGKSEFLTIDSTAKLMVRQIEVKGNKKTRLAVILREIQFSPSDSLLTTTIFKELELARQQIYNTTLFNEVYVVPVLVSATEINIVVTVKERWYLYPLPQFQPVDRNLNEWLVKYKANLSRVKYGIKFVDYNLTGRRDILKVYLLNGYTRNISFSYAQPFSSKALMEGFVFGAGYAQSREVAYKTSFDNHLLFYKNGDFVNNNLFINAGYSFRKAIKSKHFFNISYLRAAIYDSIANPIYNYNYFKDGVTKRTIIDVSYSYRYANVNNIVYPLKGTTAFVTVDKRGWGFSGGTNMLSVEGAYNKYVPLKNNWYASIQFNGKIKLPFDQPYFNQRALGYGDATLRGLEYYVIDGTAYGILKTTIKKKLISFSIPFPFKSAYFTTIPFTIYAKTFADVGYSYTQKYYDTFLNNKFLYTSGVGIDIITLYDINLKIEYSFNQLKQKGLFLQTQGGF